MSLFQEHDNVRDVVASIAATTVVLAAFAGVFMGGMATGSLPASAGEPESSGALVCVDSNVLHTPSAARMTDPTAPLCVVKLDLLQEACLPHTKGHKVEVCTFVDGKKTACRPVVSANGT